MFFMAEALRFLHSETLSRWQFLDLVLGLR
jgi:hypothetical protein